MDDGTNESARWVGATRRRVIAGAAIIASSVVLRPRDLWASGEEDVSHSAESIHQEPTFKASRMKVYEALVDTNRFDKIMEISGAKSNAALGTKPTEISREVGGTFTIFGGHIVGRQIELVENQRIVQVWRVVDWTPGVYSIAKFELVEDGSGTKIVFDHTGFPHGLGAHLAAGWKLHYWEPLAELLR